MKHRLGSCLHSFVREYIIVVATVKMTAKPSAKASCLRFTVLVLVQLHWSIIDEMSIAAFELEDTLASLLNSQLSFETVFLFEGSTKSQLIDALAGVGTQCW